MYLKSIEWHGFSDGPSSGIYSVAPLARINASEGFATHRAQEAYEEYLEFFGGKPVHFTLANHWARVVEMVYAAERIKELVNHPDIQDPNVRTLPEITPRTGIGVVEAPRGTLIHHYETDESGIITRANLLVATQHNSARINLSVDRAAKAVLLLEKGIEPDSRNSRTAPDPAKDESILCGYPMSRGTILRNRTQVSKRIHDFQIG